MTVVSRSMFVLGVAVSVAACATPATPPAAANGADTLEGEIASIDTAPWAYDGNAVIVVDTAAHGPVAVQLPARWNRCQAAPVDVEALRVGMQVRASGTMDSPGELVVCQDASHRLVPAE
jgi:hypothetical protein